MADQMRFEHRMSDSDALMWGIEKDPMLRSTIVAVAVLDRPPDRARLAERLERATRLVPRLRQRVVGNPFSVAPPRWEVDPHFDLGYHLRWQRAPAGSDLDAALGLIEPIAMAGFDRARPLWEFVVIDGLTGGGAAIGLKLHHAITDGVGAVKIGMVLFDLEREPAAEPEMPEALPVHVLHLLDRTRDAFDHERRRQLGIAKRTPSTLAKAATRLLSDPAGAVRTVANTAASAARMLTPATSPASPVMVQRSLSVQFDTITLPLGDAKAAAKVAGGRLNDFFVAGVLGGMRRYHDQHGSSVSALRMTMPINIRNAETEDLAGNAFAPA
ncbi:MAG TPA: wax ester/triacylglycerol synthase domain-containing protein, partial [Acidimicrobiales bacterium]|nr:wax ester/triacylglycerol synthase domain-containing protein [Acidimicrobiales bacterium]